ncbi:hypothetical protein HDV57DRAFT_175019 [Trichoderma longibrachiatum]
MGKLQDVTRLLMAAGGSPSADGKVTYLFREKDNSLYMETWTGPELTDNVRVVSNVRSDTPAPLVFLQYKRIFTVDKSNMLRCYTETLSAEDEDEDEDEDGEEDEDIDWEEEELDDVEVEVHPQSCLAVSCGDEAIIVLYQNPDGSLGAIEDDGIGWKLSELPTCAASPGSPLACLRAEEASYFVYVGVKGTLRYLEHGADGWKDASFSNVKINAAKSKLFAANDEGSSGNPKLMVLCLADNKLSAIKLESDEPEILGTVHNGEFKPASDQENAYEHAFSLLSYVPYHVNQVLQGLDGLLSLLPRRPYTKDPDYAQGPYPYPKDQDPYYAQDPYLYPEDPYYTEGPYPYPKYHDPYYAEDPYQPPPQPRHQDSPYVPPSAPPPSHQRPPYPNSPRASQQHPQQGIPYAHPPYHSDARPNQETTQRPPQPQRATDTQAPRRNPRSQQGPPRPTVGPFDEAAEGRTEEHDGGYNDHDEVPVEEPFEEPVATRPVSSARQPATRSAQGSLQQGPAQQQSRHGPNARRQPLHRPANEHNEEFEEAPLHEESLEERPVEEEVPIEEELIEEEVEEEEVPLEQSVRQPAIRSTQRPAAGNTRQPSQQGRQQQPTTRQQPPPQRGSRQPNDNEELDEELREVQPEENLDEPFEVYTSSRLAQSAQPPTSRNVQNPLQQQGQRQPPRQPSRQQPARQEPVRQNLPLRQTARLPHDEFQGVFEEALEEASEEPLEDEESWSGPPPTRPGQRSAPGLAPRWVAPGFAPRSAQNAPQPQPPRQQTPRPATARRQPTQQDPVDPQTQTPQEQQQQPRQAAAQQQPPRQQPPSSEQFEVPYRSASRISLRHQQSRQSAWIDEDFYEYGPQYPKQEPQFRHMGDVPGQYQQHHYPPQLDSRYIHPGPYPPSHSPYEPSAAHAHHRPPHGRLPHYVHSVHSHAHPLNSHGHPRRCPSHPNHHCSCSYHPKPSLRIRMMDYLFGNRCKSCYRRYKRIKRIQRHTREDVVYDHVKACRCPV